MSTAPPYQGRRWIWYFVILAVVAVVCLAALFIGRRLLQRQKLTLDSLKQAHDLWEQNKPPNYDLEYTQKPDSQGTTFTVKVRDGKVISAEPDARPIEQKRQYYGMDKLFDFVQQFLELDARSGQPANNLATFDPQDGHLTQFARRDPSTGQVIELTDIRLRPVTPAAEQPPASRKQSSPRKK